MGDSSTIIHTNSGLKHQVELARCLRDGFEKHGHSVTISNSPDTYGDMHVVMGPWFAYEKWKDGNTLYIDRAYWGDPDCVSIHWLRLGKKIRTRGNPPRAIPEFKPWKRGGKRIYLCDYSQKPAGTYDTVRRHPADGGTGSLADALDAHDIAIGCRTTALVDAAIAGLMVVTDDPHSPVWPIQGRRGARKQWLTDLAWHNWSKDEISRGIAWEFLSR